MNKPGVFTARLLIVAFLCVLSVSCSNEKRIVKKPVFPISGTLTVNQKPADQAKVIFYPANVAEQKEEWPFGYPNAMTDAEGNFKITTYGKDDGAPEGDYLVLVSWNEGSGENVKDRLKNKYSDPKSAKQKVQVKADNPPLQIKLAN
jgi:hypothetical protein